MSKTKKQKQDNVFMQIERFANKEPYLLQVPENIGPILDKLMRDEDLHDHRNSKAVLKIFCEEFMALDDEDQRKVETLINCKIRPIETIYDLLSIMLQRSDYYVLTGVDTKRKLGEFHITIARAKGSDSWVAKSDFADAKLVGQKIKNTEHGIFHKNNYVGKYEYF